MPTTREITIYQFDELSDSAKDSARQWFREASGSDDFYSEHVLSDFADICALLGVKLGKMRGSNRDAIYWSGFSSQGDGASFEGSYSFAKGSVAAITAHAPQDRELQRIARTLYDVQRRHFYSVTADIGVASSHYVHSGTMRADVEDCRWGDGMAFTDDESTVAQALRDLADWLYSQLEASYTDSMSDETVADNIRANEYDFDEDGARA